MSEEDLELLVTLDDPEGAPEEDTFHHRPDEALRPEKTPQTSITSSSVD